LGPAVELRAVDRTGRDRLVHRFGHSVQLVDVTNDGRALVIFWSPARLYSTRVRGAGSRIDEDISFHHRTSPLAISADARAVLATKGLFPQPPGGYYVRSMLSGSTVRLRGFDEGRALDLAADGGSVLFLEPTRIVSVPVGAGEPEPISLNRVAPSDARWFPDGQALLIKGHEEGQAEGLYILSSEAPDPRPLAPTDHDLSFVSLDAARVSPDGRSVAVHDGWKIRLYAVNGGEPSMVNGYEGDDPLLAWTSDGRGLVLRQRRCTAPARLFRLDVKTGQQEWLRDVIPPDRTGLIAVHDPVLTTGTGAFAYGHVNATGNLFLVEGLE
jgi:hypothetical protein